MTTSGACFNDRQERTTVIGEAHGVSLVESVFALFEGNQIVERLLLPVGRNHHILPFGVNNCWSRLAYRMMLSPPINAANGDIIQPTYGRTQTS